ncbi:MAG: hypothetical protein HYU39_04735 [Thaumarchaeota archaeon]|nr:hypothetical protein [Nitrososphaerota archaeon]
MAKTWSFTKYGDPDILIDYKDIDDPFTLEIPVQIVNNHSATLYFKGSAAGLPAAYTLVEQNLGSVVSGASGTVLFTGLTRTKPTARTDETFTLRIKAFTDAGYATAFPAAPQGDLTITVRLFDHSALTLVDKDDFDNDDNENWAADTGGISRDVTVYFSAPYSIHNSGANGKAFKKSFTVSAVSRAFLVLHLRMSVLNDYTKFSVGATVKMPSAAIKIFGINRWIRLVFTLPTNATTEFSLSDTFGSTNDKHIDDVWVVTE